MQGSGSVADWRLVFLKKPDAKLERFKGVRPSHWCRLLAKWYAAVVVGLLQEPEPVGWKAPHVGGGEVNPCASGGEEAFFENCET